jgi:hypothetical protein
MFMMMMVVVAVLRLSTAEMQRSRTAIRLEAAPVLTMVGARPTESPSWLPLPVVHVPVIGSVCALAILLDAPS